jgi:hypothetical protein
MRWTNVTSRSQSFDARLHARHQTNPFVNVIDETGISRVFGVRCRPPPLEARDHGTVLAPVLVSVSDVHRGAEDDGIG